LRVDLPEGLPAVRANPAQIRQVVMNLITNASEALGEKVGVITIATARVRSVRDPHANGASDLSGGDSIRLEVSDTGTGMTPEVQARMFDPFFTTKFAGRGLGLAAIQGIIRRHGGTVHVVSKPGEGSRFEILLPGTTEPAWGAVAAAGSPGLVAGTCLLVEDEETLRLSISKMLGKRGFSVIEAADGRAAVNLFRDRESEIDVVLLDVTLPAMSGREVLDAIRGIRPDVKVILTSAYNQDAALTAIGGQRAWAYIQKPYQFSALSALLRDACLERSRLNVN
jgi:CheY-like chemotaxis protein